jgi:DNA-binding transcriptional LysR family regulator
VDDSLKWDDLRAFLAVARRGSLAAAGELLGVNASTVHRRMAALEEALGAALFDRTPRGYALTGVGEALLPEAEGVEEAVLSARRAVTGHDATAQGPVVLTLPETLLGVIAPRLAAIQQRCPGLRPVLRADDRILDLGVDADVALRPSHAPPEDAVGRRVGRIAWAVYDRDGAGTAGGGAGSAAEPWVVYCDGAGPREATRWQRREHPDASVLFEVSSVGAMHRVLACTGARGLLPCYLGDATPALRRRTPPIAEAAVDLWLLIHADLRRSARVRALIDLLEPELEAAAPLLAGEREGGERGAS